MFATFKDLFSSSIAEQLERLFKDPERQLSSPLAGSVCAELLALPSTSKDQPFLVAEALGRAAQQHPFADLRGVVWTIKWLWDQGDCSSYLKLLFEIGRACNKVQEAHPVLGLNEGQKAANERAKDNQIYILGETHDRCHSYSKPLLTADQIRSVLEFQVEMCGSPYQEVSHKAQELLKEGVGFCKDLRLGESSEPRLPIKILSDFFSALLKRSEEAEQGDQRKSLVLAAQSVAYGIIKEQGVCSVALALLDEMA